MPGCVVQAFSDQLWDNIETILATHGPGQHQVQVIWLEPEQPHMKLAKQSSKESETP